MNIRTPTPSKNGLLFKLAEPDFNLCVVGDDDQGLYRFRGATIRNILEFPQQFPVGACQQVRLTTNYRSHPDIIEFYNKWMETLDWTADGKTFRYEKEIVPDAETDFTDMPAALKIAGHNTENWHEEVLAFLYRLKDSGALNRLESGRVPFLVGEASEGRCTRRSVRGRRYPCLLTALESVL